MAKKTATNSHEENVNNGLAFVDDIISIAKSKVQKHTEATRFLTELCSKAKNEGTSISLTCSTHIITVTSGGKLAIYKIGTPDSKPEHGKLILSTHRIDEIPTKINETLVSVVLNEILPLEEGSVSVEHTATGIKINK